MLTRPQRQGQEPGQVRSVLNVQEATAQVLLVDCEPLASTQGEGDVVGVNAVLIDAFSTDVRSLLGELRAEMGFDRPWRLRPLRGYLGRIATERVGAGRAIWGREEGASERGSTRQGKVVKE